MIPNEKFAFLIKYSTYSHYFHQDAGFVVIGEPASLLDKSNGISWPANTASAADSMDVVVVEVLFVRAVEVDDKIDRWNIKPSRSNISRD